MSRKGGNPPHLGDVAREIIISLYKKWKLVEENLEKKNNQYLEEYNATIMKKFEPSTAFKASLLSYFVYYGSSDTAVENSDPVLNEIFSDVLLNVRPTTVQLKTLLSKYGFNLLAKNDSSGSGSNACDYIIVQDRITNDVFIVFRGTDSIRDWMTNASFVSTDLSYSPVESSSNPLIDCSVFASKSECDEHTEQGCRFTSHWFLKDRCYNSKKYEEGFFYGFNAIDVRVQVDRLTGETPSVHMGYLNRYNKLRGHLLHDLEKILKTEGFESSRLLVTGHSLGTAIATLATFDIKLVLSEAQTAVGPQFAFARTAVVENWKNNITYHGFSSVAIGNEAFANQFREYITNAWRYQYMNDIVPPASSTMDYKHIDTLVLLGEKDLNKQSSSQVIEFNLSAVNHRMRNYISSLYHGYYDIVQYSFESHPIFVV